MLDLLGSWRVREFYIAQCMWLVSSLSCKDSKCFWPGATECADNTIQSGFAPLLSLFSCTLPFFFPSLPLLCCPPCKCGCWHAGSLHRRLDFLKNCARVTGRLLHVPLSESSSNVLSDQAHVYVNYTVTLQSSKYTVFSVPCGYFYNLWYLN